MLRQTLLTPLLFVALAATPAGAQNVILDEGSFRIERGGQPVGTETFTIRRIGQGSEAHVIANAVVELDQAGARTELKPLLRTTADLGLSAYQVEVAGQEPTEIAVTATGRRLVARTRSPSGEQEREYRATPGGVLLEEGVAHQYWFLAHLEEGDEVAVLIPRSGVQNRISVRSVTNETLRVAGETVQARHVVFEVNGLTHEVWYGSGDEVLEVRIPATGFVAERTAL